jgi:hypothetical protein
MVVYFPPESLEAEELAELSASCESTLDELTDLCGFARRRLLSVYVLVFNASFEVHPQLGEHSGV